MEESCTKKVCPISTRMCVAHAWDLPVIIFYIIAQGDDIISLIVKLALKKGAFVASSQKSHFQWAISTTSSKRVFVVH